MLLSQVTVTRTIQLRQYEPLVYSVVVTAEPGDEETAVIEYAQSLIDTAIGDARPRLRPVAVPAGSPVGDDEDVPF